MFEKISDRLKARAEKIKMIGFDVDGVLTDGSLFIGKEGELVKRFFALDGLGMKLAMQFGIKVAVVSARHSEHTINRCTDLGLEEIHVGVEDKLSCVHDLLARHELKFEEFAFIGDDSIDVTVLELAGLSACPPESHYSVFKHIHYITERAGGHGAAREFIDLILAMQGKIPLS
ncbi:MAG: HAD hydrolase family protein [Candidatus Caenarcaniphilales bacterium]|nr:HAD hydrolase family protein [Candidatus Caenarcaniphilales bacterium]